MIKKLHLPLLSVKIVHVLCTNGNFDGLTSCNAVCRDSNDSIYINLSDLVTQSIQVMQVIRKQVYMHLSKLVTVNPHICAADE